MKNFIVKMLILFMPGVLCAQKVFAVEIPATTLAMLCYVDSQDDKWTFRDFGFTVVYKDAQGKKQTLTASSKGTKKNCTNKSVAVTGKIPAGLLTFEIQDFTGQAGSTVECTNKIKYKLSSNSLGKTCQFVVKSPKFGSYTTSSECRVIVDCDAKLPLPS